jgi:hypothetical protein
MASYVSVLFMCIVWKLSAVPQKGDERRSFQVQAETANFQVVYISFPPKTGKVVAVLVVEFAS